MSSRGESGVRPAPFFDHGLFLLHLNKGKEELRRGQYEHARRELEKAQKFRPNDPEVLSNLSFTLFHLGQYEEAERMTRDLLQSHSESVPLLFNLGLILFKSGRDAEAKAPLRRVLDLTQGHRKAHLTMGLVLQRLGETAAAKTHFAAAQAGEGREDLDDTVARSARAAVTTSAASAGAADRPGGPGDGTGAGATMAAAATRSEDGKGRSAASPGPARLESQAKARAAMVAAAGPDAAPSGPSPAEVAPRVEAIPVAAPAAPVDIGPFSTRSGGFVSADCRKGLLTRRGVLMGRAGTTALRDDDTLQGALERLLVRAEGEGTLLLVDRGRRPWLRSLNEEFLSLEPVRLLAFEASLLYREDPAFEFRRLISQPFLKLFGTGVVAMAVVSEPASFEVSRDKPLTIAARTVLAYGGDLKPELLEERDPLADFGSGPVLRFVGEGYVLAD